MTYQKKAGIQKEISIEELKHDLYMWKLRNEASGASNINTDEFVDSEGHIIRRRVAVKKRNDKILEMFAGGAHREDIAEFFKISQRTVDAVILKMTGH